MCAGYELPGAAGGAAAAGAAGGGGGAEAAGAAPAALIESSVTSLKAGMRSGLQEREKHTQTEVRCKINEASTATLV